MKAVHWLAIADLEEKQNLLRELKCERLEWYDVRDTSEDEEQREMAFRAIEELSRQIKRIEESFPKPLDK